MTETKEEFAIGDVVVLKCGGPPMCVRSTLAGTIRRDIEVNWTARDGMPCKEIYLREQLTIINGGGLHMQQSSPEGEMH